MNLKKIERGFQEYQKLREIVKVCNRVLIDGPGTWPYTIDTIHCGRKTLGCEVD